MTLIRGSRLALRQAQGDREQRRKVGADEITAQLGEGGMGPARTSA